LLLLRQLFCRTGWTVVRQSRQMPEELETMMLLASTRPLVNNVAARPPLGAQHIGRALLPTNVLLAITVAPVVLMLMLQYSPPPVPPLPKPLGSHAKLSR